jgi:3-dehydroquinate synthase
MTKEILLNKQITMQTKIQIISSLFDCKLLLDICKKYSKVAIITDENINYLYGTKLNIYLSKPNSILEILTIPSGEKGKDQKHVTYIQNKLFSNNFDSDSLIIAIGGGAISDISSFISSTFLRGIDHIIIPTTLLSMIDASIGGKTAINNSFGKNLIGTIYHPKHVIIDIDFLSSLKSNEYRFAFSEIIKHSLILDEGMFLDLRINFEKYFKKDQDLLEDLIYKNIILKTKTVTSNTKDIRHILNFGHTIAHGLEKISNFQIPHGKAVSIGILVESYISYKLQLLSLIDFENIFELVNMYFSELSLDILIDNDDFVNILKHDKKAKNSNINFVLIKKIGSYYSKDSQFIHNVDKTILIDAITWMKNTFSYEKIYSK